MKLTANKKVMPSWYKPFEDEEIEMFCKPLTSLEMDDVHQHVKNDGEGGFYFINRGSEKVLNYGLLDMRHYFDDDGEKIVFTKNRAENIASLPLPLITVAVNQIIKTSSLTEDDKKK